MTPDEDAKLRAIHAAVVGDSSPVNRAIASIKQDIDNIRTIVQAQVQRNINGIRYTKTQKQDNEDTNTISRSMLYGDSVFDGLIDVKAELEALGYQIGSPDVIDYTAIGNRMRQEIDKTFFNA